MPASIHSGLKSRLRITLRGAVQGVGFRPFAHRLAMEMGLAGWVCNSPFGVLVEAEGHADVLRDFLARIHSDKPGCSVIQGWESVWLDPVGMIGFEIRPSMAQGPRSAFILPDIATCPECLREILDPSNRRHRYPFTNCTHCGPRFSILMALPYDRANTSMRDFKMCELCRAEYEDPRDRRFHAQPNACPDCGPRLEFWDAEGRCMASADAALAGVVHAIRAGRIAAVKGVGGFHLMADARNEAAVSLLRRRKHREEKPFALMFPNLDGIKSCCEVPLAAERRIASPESPIVLVRKCRDASGISEAVAPGVPDFGVMLPSNPLHHLLMVDLGFPLVATSGNLTDEPICRDEQEAVQRLRGIADCFLVHNRPIVRHMDDSIVRVVLGREMLLRRARGYAPLPISIKSMGANGKQQRGGSVGGSGHGKRDASLDCVLAVGAHLKNAVALADGGNVFMSQHIGDLETEQAHSAFLRATTDLSALYGLRPDRIVADLHPDYLSTRFAMELQTKARGDLPNGFAGQNLEGLIGQEVVQVQHHAAHVLSCIAENEVPLPALGLAWDGTGYGTDGTIWGGEFFLVTDSRVDRIAHLRSFRLPGGDKAVKEPRRVALGLLYELYGDSTFEMGHLPPLRAIRPVEMMTLRGMLQRAVNSPRTSSIGRLFDALASLTDVRHESAYEGHAAMSLEHVIAGVKTDKAYELRFMPGAAGHPFILDWVQMVGNVLSDLRQGVPVGMVSAKFHNALAEAAVSAAAFFRQRRVVLSGGCFQNRYLLETTVNRLEASGCQAYWHQRVPTNDGGIALGQIVAALRMQNR